METVLEILVACLLVVVELALVAFIVAPKAVLRRVREFALGAWRGAANLVRPGRSGSPRLSRS